MQSTASRWGPLRVSRSIIRACLCLSLCRFRSAPASPPVAVRSAALCGHALHEEVAQHDNADDDAVDAEGREVVALDVAHQELDGDDGHEKRGHDADDEDDDLGRAHGKACMRDVFHNLHQAPAEHDGDGQEEREFRGSRARAAGEHAADDGGAGAGRAGNDGEHLEATDLEGGPPIDVVDRGSSEPSARRGTSPLTAPDSTPRA